MKEGCIRLNRNLTLKKDLESKNKELEFNRLKTLVSLKEEDDSNNQAYENEISQLNERLNTL